MGGPLGRHAGRELLALTFQVQGRGPGRPATGVRRVMGAGRPHGHKIAFPVPWAHFQPDFPMRESKKTPRDDKRAHPLGRPRKPNERTHESRIAPAPPIAILAHCCAPS